MADKGSYDKSVDNIEEQIRKLVEEKEELERRNKEKQQEQRLRLMKENISAQRANTSLGASSSSNRDFGDLSDGLSATLVESQTRIRSMQHNLLNLSKDGSSNLNDSRDDSQRSSDDADGDDVMSSEHKQALRVNRDILVENMTPDDIFNDLISRHILTNADVSRIKERNTTEAVNEELLNVLIRRSDRAFHVFVASLRRTLQGWLASRIDPDSQQQKNKRKRRSGELEVNLNCERIVPVSKKRHTCTCQEVEEQLLIMAKGALSHIRRRDGTSASFEQFKKELKQTNEAIMETMETVNALKILCRHGEITDMTEGSVCFTICCSSFASCQTLWEAYESGSLLVACQRGLVTPALLQICSAKKIHLCVKISRLEYLTCALELAHKEKRDLQVRHTKPANTKTKKVSFSQDENSPGEFTKVLIHKNGQAFKEIPVNTIHQSYLTKTRSPVNGCEKLKNALNAQNSPVRGLSPDHKPQRAHRAGQCRLTTEQFIQSDMQLRSHGKDAPPNYKCVLDQILLQGCSAGSCKIVRQITKRCKENAPRARQEDICPYNLRYRLLNHKGCSI